MFRRLISAQTALLRQVLTRTKYHVLHFDLRIAGFADLPSLYMSLRFRQSCLSLRFSNLDHICSQQMEAFFTSIAQDPELPGYEGFEKQAWGFKVAVFLRCHVSFTAK